MNADVGAAAVEGVQEADGEGFRHAGGDLVRGEPGDCCRLVGGAFGAACGFAAEDQGDDGAGHVLVDAGEFVHLDFDACLLQDLAGYAGGRGFVEFEDSAGEFPSAVVGAADGQESAVVPDYDPGDGDGVQGSRRDVLWLTHVEEHRRRGRTMGTAVGGGNQGPRYVQIADEIVQQIRAGVLKPGDMVPSESELVDRYGVSGGTIRKAMVEVRASGLVETRHGKGSIVKDRPPVRHRSSDRFRRSLRQGGQAAYLAESAQSGATAKVSVVYVGPVEAPEDAARRLGVPVGAQVLARRRLYFRNGTPVETATSYLPWDVVKEIPELFAENPGGGGIYARLEDHGHEFAEFVETLQARPATKSEAAELALSPAAPVVHLVREARTTAGLVVEVCDTLMAADQFVFEYHIPAGD